MTPAAHRLAQPVACLGRDLPSCLPPLYSRFPRLYAGHAFLHVSQSDIFITSSRCYLPTLTKPAPALPSRNDVGTDADNIEVTVASLGSASLLPLGTTTANKLFRVMFSSTRSETA